MSIVFSWQNLAQCEIRGQIHSFARSYPFMPGFPSSDSKESAFNTGDPGSVPQLGRSPGEGNGNPLQYCCQETSMDRGVWRAIIHGVTKSWTWLSDFHFHATYCYWKVGDPVPCCSKAICLKADYPPTLELLYKVRGYMQKQHSHLWQSSSNWFLWG